MADNDPGFEHPAGEDLPAGDPVSPSPSLADDITALLDDGRTYLEAEVQYQKSRAAFALNRGKSGAVYGIAALALLHLALVALVVGLVIALSPLITPWGATAAVVAALALGAAFLGLKAKRLFARSASVYSEPRP